jgi:hypothetical protein
MHSFEDAEMNYEDALGICVAALAIKIVLITMCTVSTAVAPTLSIHCLDANFHTTTRTPVTA